MQFSSVFLPKTGRDLHLISRPLAPNNKQLTFFHFEVIAYYLLLHEGSFCYCIQFNFTKKAVGEFLFFLLYLSLEFILTEFCISISFN